MSLLINHSLWCNDTEGLAAMAPREGKNWEMRVHVTDSIHFDYEERPRERIRSH